MARRTHFSTKGYGRATSGSVSIIITDYKRFVNLAKRDARRIMLNAAKMTLQAILPYVPIETGALRESGRASVVETGKGIAALVSFGGPDAPVTPTKNAPEGIVFYAGAVNYDIEKFHEIGQAMFMEEGIQQSKDKVDSYIMAQFKRIKP